MFNIIKKQINWGGVTLELETGKIARQSTAVVAKMGDTVVLCAIVASNKPKEGINFFPLTVHYLEKFYAIGKIPGGFLKRENKPSEREVLISRLIDRPIRPLFADNYYNEVQIVCTVLSYDGVNDSDILSIIAASAALAISDIPFTEVLAAARVGYKNGEFILNPSKAAIVDSDMDLVVAGTDLAVLMVESEAKELSEEVMLKAVIYGQQAFKPVIQMIKDFASEVGTVKSQPPEVNDGDVVEKINSLIGRELSEAYLEPDKLLRNKKVKELLGHSSLVQLIEEKVYSANAVEQAFDKLAKQIVRHRILQDSKRIDGRTLDEIRPINCEVDLLPRTHGSALFTRGSTQALVVATLGTTHDEQITDDLTGNRLDYFMLHYNFPSYSVGEVGIMKAPGRREIGHGKLAFKSMLAVLPPKYNFPYTIRVVSEITESNGSSSMATVCGTSLAIMAAGVPITRPVSGIAMGLIKEGDQFAVLSDIMGDEDHLGDMDFKVAGTEKGITALQMDIKINGINENIMIKALEQAKVGRQHILDQMTKTLASSRTDLNPNAPRIVSIMINKSKIREVIGAGGKVIRDICEQSGAKIDIDDSGKITIAAVSAHAIDNAVKIINGIIAEPEIGQVYEGIVTKITNFGAFVKFLANLEGMVHISEISNSHVDNVSDVLREGELIKVKVIGIERGGKIRLTMKNIVPKDVEEGTETIVSVSDNTSSEADLVKHKPRPFNQNKKSATESNGLNNENSKPKNKTKELQEEQEIPEIKQKKRRFF